MPKQQRLFQFLILMTTSQKINPVLIIAAIIISCLCWYLSCDLSGNYWYLLWFAPIPVLLLVLQVSARPAFVFAFVAYLIGRLSWLSYLLIVVPTPPAILFTIL